MIISTCGWILLRCLPKQREEKQQRSFSSRHAAYLPQMTPQYWSWQPATIIIQQEWRALFDMCWGNLVGKIEQSPPLPPQIVTDPSAYGARTPLAAAQSHFIPAQIYIQKRVSAENKKVPRLFTWLFLGREIFVLENNLSTSLWYVC